jgi:hypothetical protein
VIPVNAGHSIRCCAVVFMGSSYTGDESLHGVGGSNLDFLLISFVQVIVHSTGPDKPPDLGGAPSPFPTVGN